MTSIRSAPQRLVTDRIQAWIPTISPFEKHGKIKQGIEASIHPSDAPQDSHPNDSRYLSHRIFRM